MSNPFKLVSTLDGPAEANEVQDAWRGHGLQATRSICGRHAGRLNSSRTSTMGSGGWPF
jgi:hypothetical protein